VPPLSDEDVPVAQAQLPEAWTQGDLESFQIVVTTGPYRVSDYAIEQLRVVMQDQAGLNVEVVQGQDTGLSATGVLDHLEVVKAGAEQIPPGDGAVIVLVVVENTTAPNATWGYITWTWSPRPVAIMMLHAGPIVGWAVGPLTSEILEATVTIHEVGHWLGVPARDNHISSLSAGHCSNARCVMYKGIQNAPVCAVLSNLNTGVPVRFGEQCAEELAEMTWRRQENGN
jgi:hypothetical protein